METYTTVNNKIMSSKTLYACACTMLTLVNDYLGVNNKVHDMSQVFSQAQHLLIMTQL